MQYLKNVIIRWLLHSGNGFELYALYRKYVRKNISHLMVSKQTDLLVEGYGGSANSYAVYVFEAAQHQTYKLAHHYHLAGHVLLARKWNVPTLIIVQQQWMQFHLYIHAITVSNQFNKVLKNTFHSIKKYTLFAKRSYGFNLSK